jgi:hypothetical protein
MQDRMAILEAIERGDLSVQEGIRKLDGSGGESSSAGSAHAAHYGPRAGARPALARVIWQAVLWSGVLLVVVGGLLVAAVYAWAIPAGWRVAGWVLLGLGIVTALAGWWLRTARWLSVRVQEGDGTNIALAFPLPLGLSYWALRIARKLVPGMGDVPIEESIVALEDALREGEPFFVDVHDEDDGDHVQVYLS